LIFATNTIIPQAILPILPKATFELMPEEPKPVIAVSPDVPKPTAAAEPLG
jgi:hypothetical protein